MVKINELHDMEKENLYPDPDYDVGQDLMIFMRNDPMFYRKNYFPALEDYKEQKKDQFINDMVRHGLKKYCEKFGLPHNEHELLGDGDINEIVKNIIKDEFEGE